MLLRLLLQSSIDSCLGVVLSCLCSVMSNIKTVYQREICILCLPDAHRLPSSFPSPSSPPLSPSFDSSTNCAISPSLLRNPLPSKPLCTYASPYTSYIIELVGDLQVHSVNTGGEGAQPHVLRVRNEARVGVFPRDWDGGRVVGVYKQVKRTWLVK